MIDIKDKHNCCGCEGCVQVCPKHCIHLYQDKEGFFYPKVETSLCIECDLCKNVCPVINIREQSLPREVWAAQNKDKTVRENSSSGGIATMLAEKIINEKGVVFGVVMNEKCDAVHKYAETSEQLVSFRGSKYIQSKIGNTFQQVRDFLNAERQVLFIGTPCQVSGLKCFLRKDYPNLFTVDFICHGVASPGIFKWYLQEELNKLATTYDTSEKNTGPLSNIHSILLGDIRIPEGIKIMDIRFRDKKDGWKKYSLALNLVKTSIDGKLNTVLLSENVINNAFLRGFTTNLYLRPSCHQCPTRNYRSGSDITIGDFWGQEITFPDFDNDTGVSCIIIKSKKGLELFNSIRNIKKEPKAIEDVLSFNPSLVSSPCESYGRRKFWRNIGKYSFKRTVQKALTLNIVERVGLKIKNIIE